MLFEIHVIPLLKLLLLLILATVKKLHFYIALINHSLIPVSHCEYLEAVCCACGGAVEQQPVDSLVDGFIASTMRLGPSLG